MHIFEEHEVLTLELFIAPKGLEVDVAELLIFLSKIMHEVNI